MSTIANISVLFLPPYYPIVYDNIVHSDDYQNVTEVEKYLTTLARERNISTFGSYNPQKAGTDESDFFDGMHPKESGIQKMFRGYNQKFVPIEQ